MLASLFNTESLRRRDADTKTHSGDKKKTCLQEQLVIFIYLRYVEASLAQVCALWATREQ